MFDVLSRAGTGRRVSNKSGTSERESSTVGGC